MHPSVGAGYRHPGMAPPPVPRVDLYEIAKGQAWRQLWTSILLVIGGLVFGALALAIGFIVFVAIAMIFGGVILFFVALAALTDPTRALKNLGPTEVHRRQAMRLAEAELANPSTSVLNVGPGTALLGPTWLVYYDKSALLVAQRSDVIWLYVEQKKNNKTLKVHLRAMNVVDIDLDDARSALLPAFSQALPFAFAGFDPSLAATPLHVLAQEVDRRRASALGGPPQGYGPAPVPYAR
ncbi:MAG: hypothetical protein JST00_16805 [Deltaproteobacteria bacterium]|nr:hypothetical protein [Deltaproteobacteria bacterium]